MKVRTITLFVNPGWPLRDAVIAAAGQAAEAARAAFAEAGYEVQTIRLATPPFPDVLGPENAAQAVRFALEVEAAAFVHGFEYISVGPVGPAHDAAFVEVLPDIVEATQDVFVSMSVAEVEAGLSLLAVRQASQTVRRIAELGENGQETLRFAALARVPPGVPFFPAAYARAGQDVLSIGLEAADVIVQAVENAHTLAEARAAIVAQVEEHGRRLAAAAKKGAGVGNVRFGGIDFSPAPFPGEAASLGRALERLGAPRVGWNGTLAAAAFIADALDRAQFPRAGFCGLFLPVLEDSVLAERAGEGILSVSDLLLYSAVCGAGLDTVPLPGDITADEMAAIILDMAALALRLGKPLSARLMPVRGKLAGDEVVFDFPYFVPARVLAHHAGGLAGLLDGVERFGLNELLAR